MILMPDTNFVLQNDSVCGKFSAMTTVDTRKSKFVGKFYMNLRNPAML